MPLGSVARAYYHELRARKAEHNDALKWVRQADITPTSVSDGWDDFTVTAGADSSWSRRFIRHIENRLASVTG